MRPPPRLALRRDLAEARGNQCERRRAERDLTAEPSRSRWEAPLREISRAPHKGVPYERYFGIGLIAGNNAPLPIISFTTAGSFATVALA